MDRTGKCDVLAWGYVGLRVAHSLYQARFNFITVRFLLYALATILLMVMSVRSLFALLGATFPPCRPTCEGWSWH